MSLLDDATLEGGLVRVRFGDAIQHARENLSIDGAPTVTLTLLDPDRRLVESQLWAQRSTLRLGGQRYVLVQTDKQGGGVLTLTFEQWEVYLLRQARGYGQEGSADTARRKTTTRVEFAERLTRASGVKFHAPEAGPPPPLYQKVADKGAKKKKADPWALPGADEGAPAGGFDAGTTKDLRIGRDGGKPPTKAQLDALSAGLGEAVRLKVTDNETLIGMIMAGIMESEWNPKIQEYHRSNHWGLFQQNTTDYTRPDAGDPVSQVHEFLIGTGTWQEDPWQAKTDLPQPGSFVLLMRGFTGARRTIGDVVETRQGSGKGGGAYDAFHAQAQALLAAYSNAGWTAPRKRALTDDRYEFARGEPGRPETSWDCLGRLADEIGWRRFMVADTVWFVSDEWLMATPALATLREGDGVVEAITWTLDAGKARDECSADVTDLWVRSPGVVVRVEGEGPADGKWLLAEWERDLLAPNATVRLVKPGAISTHPVGVNFGDPAKDGMSNHKYGGCTDIDAVSIKGIAAIEPVSIFNETAKDLWTWLGTLGLEELLSPWHDDKHHGNHIHLGYKETLRRKPYLSDAAKWSGPY